MSRETLVFMLVLAGCVLAFFHESLLGGKVLSPADVLFVEASFRPLAGPEFEPRNRLLMDPVLQFQPWLEFNRAMIREGRLPLWNPYAGCGAPHLANGQSAVFDPFNFLAYATTVSGALVWMAAARLWVAGLGAYLLAKAWRCEFWGRWFAGLSYPFCGFLVVWLLYPVTPVAIWLPWLLLAGNRVIERPSARAAGLLAIIVALLIFGGHIQTSAHALLASALFAVWKLRDFSNAVCSRRKAFAAWAGSTILGLLIASVQIFPLGVYLTKSPVWGDRQRETKAWWSLARPRLLDAVCTALPYAYGSQRQGHPNLGKALGVNNLNEASGGYAGLVTLLWLAPFAIRDRRWRGEAGFLALLVIVGALAAFRVPPVDNLLRLIPVLNVTDNRRLTLWIAFGLCFLGAFGIDAVRRAAVDLPRGWIALWLLGAIATFSIAVAVPRFEPMLNARAEQYYRGTIDANRGIDEALAMARASRQVRAAVEFFPRYYGAVGCELAALAVLGLLVKKKNIGGSTLAAVLLSLTFVELFLFGKGLNPSIPPAIQTADPPAITALRDGLPPGHRALGIGDELPPNVLMRFGLSDPRNYDSVEMARSLQWFAPLYEPGNEAQTSRREITWEGVQLASDRLRDASVSAVVGAVEPPPGLFDKTEKLGEIWIGWWKTPPLIEGPEGASIRIVERQPGRLAIEVESDRAGSLVVRETHDDGWHARLDGNDLPIGSYRETFMTLNFSEGKHTILLEYVPFEVILGLFSSLAGVLGVILALTDRPHF